MLFGGTGPSGNLADTWLWNGANWEQQIPATSPSARDLHNMTFNPDLNVVVLFGGGGGLSDTWTWDGGTWTQITPATVPPQRYAFSMDFDAAADAVVLFGGFTANGPAINDTWVLGIGPQPPTLAIPPSYDGTNVTVSWSASPTSGVVGYNVYQATTSGGPYTKIGSLVTGTSFQDSSTVAGNTYYYVLTAVLSNGIEGVKSNEVSIFIPHP